MKLFKRNCIECSKEYERDEDTLVFKKMMNQIGCLADQCNECLEKMRKEMKE